MPCWRTTSANEEEKMQTDDELTRFAAQGAEYQGRVVGLTHYLLHRSTSQLQPNCYLQDLFTAETVRGKGVARALIAAVYERAQQLGLPRVYWNTHETNQTAMRLYDKVAERPGFVMYRKAL
ncbi:GNAT family N-acetyltransferase [Serratia sp. TSA_105.2]